MRSVKQFGIVACAVVALLGFRATDAAASTFDFSYVFSNGIGAGTRVTGSFVGDKVTDVAGDYVTNILNSSLTLSFGSGPTSFVGPLFLITYGDLGIPPGPVVAPKVFFTKGLNNILILNCNLTLLNPCAATSQFLVRNGVSSGSEDGILLFGGNVIGQDRDYTNSPWTLTERTASAVPEPASLLLLGSGLMAVMFRIRKSRA